MNLASTIASIISAAAIIGGGMYKLGSGFIAMSTAIKSLTSLTGAQGTELASHDARLAALENPARTGG